VQPFQCEIDGIFHEIRLRYSLSAGIFAPGLEQAMEKEG
jgi:hypothetical protein